jgi:repressor LexA
MTSPAAITPKQLDLLRAIRAHWAEHGYGPTHAELCEVLGLSSTQALRDKIESLHGKGLVALTPATARTLRLTDAGNDAATALPIAA